MFIWICMVAGAVYIDQLSKWLAVIFLTPGKSVEVIPWFIRFDYTENPGAAWGMFENQRWLFMAISSIAIIAIFVYVLMKKPKDKLLIVSLAMIAGGGIGNMIDRIFLGKVVDFLEFTFMDFPIFNGADSFVTIGAALMIVYLIITAVKEKKNAGLQKQQPEDRNDKTDGSDGDRTE